jgi:hypothetical protein
MQQGYTLLEQHSEAFEELVKASAPPSSDAKREREVV